MITQSSLQARQRHPYHHLVEPPLHLGGFPIGNEVDPQLLALAAAASGHSSASQIDPALFAIEQVVNDVNRGRIGITDLGLSIGAPSTREERNDEPEAVHGIPAPPALEISDDASHGHVDMPPEADSIHIQLDDDGIDPALREIVNSLTNAQQSHHPNLPADSDERDRIDRERLQQTMQTTLEDYAAQNGFGGYGAIFGGAFPHSPNNNLLMPSLNGETEPSPNHSIQIAPPSSDATTPGTTPMKRGRGRPKGSKNKPKPPSLQPPPPPEPIPEPERKPKGRPPKIRSAEELAEFERRKEEKALGIKRKRGRPRKYPELGLVREMRLKKNREAVQEKIRMLEERDRLREGDVGGEQHLPATLDSAAGLNEVALGEQVAAAVTREQEHTEHYGWPYQDNQTLLDVVNGVGIGVGVDDRSGMGVGVGVGLAGNGGMTQNDDMRGVFSLGHVGP